MVMDGTLSPQCVGREFVRQYYTLLNEAPTHLHRFYNNSSCFIHGGLDPPNKETRIVVGQREIHHKIQQLNFRDCHAKITQVDSQATLGNGVVVQVTGELSNAGQPMRRFTQTFVLAFQAPKKYYVHNDIFRYQDMLTEEEYDEMTRTEIENNNNTNNNNNMIQQNSKAQPPKVVDTPDNSEYYGGGGDNEVTMVNGESQHHSETEHLHQVVPPPTVQQQQNTTPSPHQIQNIQPMNSEPVVKDEAEEDLGFSEATEPSEPRPLSPPPTSNTASAGGGGVKTYANLVKGKNCSSNSPNAVYQPVQQQQQQQQPVTAWHQQPPLTTIPAGSATSASPPTTHSNLSNVSGGASPVERSKPQRDTMRTPSFSSSNRYPEEHNSSVSAEAYDNDRRRPPAAGFSDSQQLFFGNVPHSATEDELRAIFGKFGKILDIRVLSKNKGIGNTKVPNYGFIIFEDVASVQQVLEAKPIKYPDENGGVKLNVEEKKTRVRGEGGRGGGGRLSGGGRGTPSRLPPRNNFRR